MPFGLSYIQPKQHETLLLIEGEINCISVWQCQVPDLSVLSFGAEGGGDNRVLESISVQYKNVYVWADDVFDDEKKKNRASELRGFIRGKGQAVRSVKKDGTKYDANHLLKIGALPMFIDNILSKTGES